MSCAYTLSQLITDTLLQLRIITAEGTPAAYDHDYMKRLYDQKHSEWQKRELVYWPNTSASTEEIPAEVYNHLRDLLLNQCANAFGKGWRPPEQVQATEEMLLKSLRRTVSTNPSGVPTRVDTF